MDLRSLIAKMDAIEQSQLLAETEELMEKVRIRYSDVEAVANQYKDDEAGRLAALTKLIQDNGLPGLFDPIKKELVKPDGTYAWFAGADEATVKRLQQWGLLPDEAKTSSWLGARGEDEKTAMPANKEARSRDEMVDRAEVLMKKAIAVAKVEQGAKPSAPTTATASGSIELPKFESTLMFKSGLAKQLTEGFGFSYSSLMEAITPEEHAELKGLVQKLTPFAKTDPDSADIVAQFRAYNEKRDALIARIQELIELIKSKGVKPVVKESLNESKVRMIMEGRIVVLEDQKRYLRDGMEWTYDASTQMYSHLNEDGTIDQLDEEGFWQGVGDFGRGVANGATLGMADRMVAGAKAMIKGSAYRDELRKELVASKAARDRSPNLSLAGDIAGSFVLPGGFLAGLGWAGANYAMDKLKKPYDDEIIASKPTGNTPAGGAAGGQGAQSNLLAMQKAILAKDPKALPKHGADGKMGPETRAAMAKYPDIAAKFKVTPAATPAKPVTPTVTPAATPTIPTTRGDAGTDAAVAEINAAFKKLGVTAIDANGAFTPEAIQAVKKATQQSPNSKDADIINKILSGGATQATNEDALGGLLKLLGKTTTGAADNVASAAAKTTANAADNVATAANKTAGAVEKTAAAAEAKIGAGFTDDAGTAWMKRAGYWEPVAGPLKGMKNQVGMKSNPGMYAKIEAEFAEKTGTKVAGAGDDVAKAAGATDDAAKATAQADEIAKAEGVALSQGEKTVIAATGKNSTKVSRALVKAKKAGGRVVQFMKDHKFLTLMAALAIGGYLFNDDGDIDSDVSGGGAGAAGGPTTPTKPEGEQGGKDSAETIELNKLLAQLRDGWPTDEETKATLEAAKAVGGKVDAPTDVAKPAPSNATVDTTKGPNMGQVNK